VYNLERKINWVIRTWQEGGKDGLVDGGLLSSITQRKSNIEEVFVGCPVICLCFLGVALLVSFHA
jgi:hypothetical protein